MKVNFYFKNGLFFCRNGVGEISEIREIEEGDICMPQVKICGWIGKSRALQVELNWKSYDAASFVWSIKCTTSPRSFHFYVESERWV